jgi:hypothetical protein
MNAGLIAVTASSATSSPNGPSLPLWVPPCWAAVAAAAIVLAAGCLAWKTSGISFKEWFNGPVYAGPAWTAKDSWVTNIAAVGAILGTVVTDSGTSLKTVILATPAAGVTILFIVFGGAAAAAPVVYGATAKLESQGITDTKGSAWGLLVAGAASLFAVLGEMATLGLLVCGIASSAPPKVVIVIAICVGAVFIGAYSLRSLMYFATVPVPRPKKAPADSALTVRQSFLGNQTFSATL